MKIIHSVFTTGWGGLEKYPLTLEEHLRKKGHELILITIKGTNLHQEALRRNIKVYTIDNFKKLNFKIIKKLREIAIKEKIDVIHMNSSREYYNWYMAIKGLKNIKIFLTFHIGIPSHKTIIHKILYKRLNGAFAISTVEAQEMKSKLKIDNSKIYIMHNGVDLGKFNKNVESHFREEIGIDNKEILVTSIGNLSKPKGVLEWKEVAKKFVKEMDNITFVWVGDDSHIQENYSLESLRNEIEVEGYGDKIKMLGYRTDVSKVLKGSNLFVLPSHNESFGLVYIEAMAMGLPVIGCNVGGVPDIIQEGTGFLCEPKSVDSLYENIKLMLKEDLKEIGNGNVEYVKRFSMDKHIDRLISVYEEK